MKHLSNDCVYRDVPDPVAEAMLAWYGYVLTKSTVVVLQVAAGFQTTKQS